MEFYASLIKVIEVSVLLFTNISFVLKLSFSLYYNWWPPINFFAKIEGLSYTDGKILNSFNHNWELVFLTKLQYNNNTILHKSKYLQYNTISKHENCQQFNTIRAPHYCIAIQFTLNWPTLSS